MCWIYMKEGIRRHLKIWPKIFKVVIYFSPTLGKILHWYQYFCDNNILYLGGVISILWYNIIQYTIFFWYIYYILTTLSTTWRKSRMRSLAQYWGTLVWRASVRTVKTKEAVLQRASRCCNCHESRLASPVSGWGKVTDLFFNPPKCRVDILRAPFIHWTRTGHRLTLSVVQQVDDLIHILVAYIVRTRRRFCKRFKFLSASNFVRFEIYPWMSSIHKK